ncbi:MAG: bifunctional nuclease family protein [Saprospiraceae bacterium]|nr:bifunctional nuclease family protein [Saprospiraceae bacterium]
MKRIELEIVALSHSMTQSHNYAVVLGERRGKRRLPIVIGSFEAQAIAVALERMVPNRPLTHDLFKNAFDAFDIQLKEVIISNLLDGIFYARLVCVKNGELFEIDSRTSDAIAMAVRFECPIFTYDFILEAAGVILEEQEGGSFSTVPAPAELDEDAIETWPIDALRGRLQESLDHEESDMAAKIRDDLKRREEKDSHRKCIDKCIYAEIRGLMLPVFPRFFYSLFLHIQVNIN